MASVACGLPILPGQADACRQLTQELQGPRRSEMKQMLRRAGMRLENRSLQTTPQGALCIVYLEAADMTRAFNLFASDDAPFARWYKQQL